jgi:hypothetical protein
VGPQGPGGGSVDGSVEANVGSSGPTIAIVSRARLAALARPSTVSGSANTTIEGPEGEPDAPATADDPPSTTSSTSSAVATVSV